MQIKKGGSRMSDKKDFVYATPTEKDLFIAIDLGGALRFVEFH